MIISHKHKFIFLKTKKTAGSSLEKILMKYAGPDDICTGSERDHTPRVNTKIVDGHIPASKIRQMFPDEWGSYFKFTIERNPWDFFVSRFYWYTVTKKRRAKRGFDVFIRDPKNLDTNWDLYTDGNNNILVDKIFKYETLHEELTNQNILPYDGELEHVRLKSGYRKDSNYKSMYTDETKEIVFNKCKNIIDLFDYKF